MGLAHGQRVHICLARPDFSLRTCYLSTSISFVPLHSSPCPSPSPPPPPLSGHLSAALGSSLLLPYCLSQPPTSSRLPPLSAFSLFSLSLFFFSPFFFPKKEEPDPSCSSPLPASSDTCLPELWADGARMGIGGVRWVRRERAEPGARSSCLQAAHLLLLSSLAVTMQRGSLVTPGKSGTEKHWV